jgi:lipid II:glycine glycyltransferase (peptidoglycan interpeptide bridge formation enzyme)
MTLIASQIDIPTLTPTILSPAYRAEWNAFVYQHPYGHLMQSFEWGDYKSQMNWQAIRLGLRQGANLVAGAQILLKSLPGLPVSVAYIPKGPVVDFENRPLTQHLFQLIHHLAQRKRVLFLKIEPVQNHAASTAAFLSQLGFKPSPQTNQPRSTQVVDLRPGPDEVLLNMRKTTRKLIRRGLRNADLIVRPGTIADLTTLQALISTTADLKGFPAHPLNYYRLAWQAFCQPKPNTAQSHILVAEYQGQPLAVKLFFTYKERSMHFWGGYSREHSDVHASYLIQWAAMEKAMSLGCTACDLWGIPDEVGAMLNRGEEIPKDRTGDLWGPYNFKRGFGGQVEYYLGAYDYAYWPALYWLLVEKIGQGLAMDQLASLLEQVQKRFKR